MPQVNPMQIITMIKQGQNPQQVLMQIMEGKMSNSPFGQNLINLARNDKSGEIETIVRNYVTQHGVDYDKAFTQFRQMLGL